MELKNKQEFKPIPYFCNYSINREGKVINENGKEIACKNNKVTLKYGNGKSTSRTPGLLVREVFGEKK